MMYLFSVNCVTAPAIYRKKGTTIFTSREWSVIDLVSNRQEGNAVFFIYRHRSSRPLRQWIDRLIKALEGQANTKEVDRLGFGVK